MNVALNSSILLADYKVKHNIARLDLFKSKKTNKLYACHPDGTFVGMVSEDIDFSKPIAVVSVTDTDSGESWCFLGNSDRTPVRSL